MERSELVLEVKGVERQEIDYVIPLVYACRRLSFVPPFIRSSFFFFSK